MATISWTNNSGAITKKHIESSGYTLCGLAIPYQNRHKWNACGEAECKRCIAKQEKTEKKQPE